MMDSSEFSETRIAGMVEHVEKYFRDERALYLPASEPLTVKWKSAVESHFPNSLLDSVRTIVLDGARIPPPPFYAEAVELSSGNFPDFVHLASVTYIDIVVFNEPIQTRTLFHGMVHAQQFACLGIERYLGLYIRGFLKHRTWVRIPLEVQAFKLEERFMISPPEAFSVENEVYSWMRRGEYE
jgi:hypothetical protein